MIRHAFVVVAMVLGASEFASAASESCEARAAADKQLSSFAARANFIKKCQADAKEAAAKVCSTQAEGQQLAGSAKTRFVKKCVKDATTSKRPNALWIG